MKFLLVLPVLLATAYGWLSDCGRSKYPDAGESGFGTPYVVGGREARQGEYPYQVSLRRVGSHFCGGVIINNNWVLSAAHCTTGESAGDVTVAVGQHVRSDDSEPSKVIHRVDRIIDHENYDSATISNDISLLRMSDAISMNDDVQPACRPNTESYEGQTGIVSGWGAIFSGGPGSDALRSALVHSIMSDDMCHISFPGQIYEGMVCAGQLGSNPTDTCQGDSGGPMAVKNGGRFTVVGLTSWGRGCASETPGVYARVSTYLGWISGHIGG